MAQRMDLALMEGGTWEALATKVGKTKGVLRSHARFRTKSGKWRLTEKRDHVKMIAGGQKAR